MSCRVGFAIALLAASPASAAPTSVRNNTDTQTRKLARVLAANPSMDRVDAIRRSLLGLKLRDPDRYTAFIRSVNKLSPGRGPAALRRLADSVARQEQQANLLIVSLGSLSSHEKPVRQVLSQMRKDKPAQYARFKATIDAYMSAFMETYDCFGHSGLYQMYSARVRRKSPNATPPAASALYSTVMAQLATLRGLFATVESGPTSKLFD